MVLKIKQLLLLMPSKIRNYLYLFREILLSPRNLEAFKRYVYSDEHLKFVHILEAVNYLRIAGVDGKILPNTYFEFGCHSGRTFSAAINSSKFLKLSNMNFFAFDSFEGLPETDFEKDGVFKEGTFSTSIDQFKRIIKLNTGMKLPEFNIVKGFYSNSLTLDLQNQMPKVGIAHIDVDLYSSTKEVLKFLKPLLVEGSVILFDDWYCFPGGSNQGERKALTEFLNENPEFKVEPWKSYSTFGQSYFVTKISGC